MPSNVITAATRARAHVRPAEAAQCAGLAVVVVGSFLPWLQSGSVTRNSYASDAVLRRLWDVGGVVGGVLSVWPFVSLACAAGVALALLGMARAGAAVAVVAAAGAGAVALTVLNTDGHVLARPATTGPAVTTAGAVLVWLAVLVRYVPLDRLTRRP